MERVCKLWLSLSPKPTIKFKCQIWLEVTKRFVKKCLDASSLWLKAYTHEHEIIYETSNDKSAQRVTRSRFIHTATSACKALMKAGVVSSSPPIRGFAVFCANLISIQHMVMSTIVVGNNNNIIYNHKYDHYFLSWITKNISRKPVGYPPKSN